MPKGYRKIDVQFHADWMHDERPAVNVKVYGSIDDVKLPLDLGSFSEDGGKTFTAVTTDPKFTQDWVRGNVIERDQEVDTFVWEFAIEDGREQITEFAKELWGPNTKVDFEGRSGGWAVPHGGNMSSFEDWNAIDLAKWYRFEKYAKAVADDVPRAMLENIYVNEFEVQNESE